jgi:hypothetical protein
MTAYAEPVSDDVELFEPDRLSILPKELMQLVCASLADQSDSGVHDVVNLIFTSRHFCEFISNDALSVFSLVDFVCFPVSC